MTELKSLYTGTSVDRSRFVLDPDQAQRFILFLEGLRSGRFEQVKNRLRDYFFTDDEEIKSNPEKPHWGFCCLGVMTEVACEIQPGIVSFDPVARSYTWQEELVFSKGFEETTELHSLHEEAVLPNPVMSLFGMTQPGPEVIMPCGFHVVEATWLNDEGDWTFSQIADAFAYTYLGVAYPSDLECPECRAVAHEGPE